MLVQFWRPAKNVAGQLMALIPWVALLMTLALTSLLTDNPRLLQPPRVVALASCSSGQRPETGGVEPGRYIARFSGEWTLDGAASDDPGRVVEAHGREGARAGGAGGGGRGHGPGGGGGRGPGGHGGGGFPGGRGPDPAALEATFHALRAVPDRFTLTVTESLVVTTWTGDAEARMPVAGDAIPLSVRGRRIEARTKWNGGKLQIERRIEGGGRIGVTPEIRLVFDRAE